MANQVEQLVLGGVGVEPVQGAGDAGLFTGPLLVADVDRAGRVVADQDGGQVGGDTAVCVERRNLHREFFADRRCDRLAVDNRRRHGRLPPVAVTWSPFLDRLPVRPPGS